MDNEKRGACHEPSANVRRLWRAVVDKSEADNFEEARWEWHVVKCYDASACDPSAPAERCICGHEPIIECFVLLNRLNGNVLDPVGNVCVRQFGRDDMDDVVRTLHDVNRLRSAFELLGDDEELPIKRFESADNRAPLTRRAAEWLLRAGAFEHRPGDGLSWCSAERAYDVVTTALSKRHPSGKLLRFAHVIVERRVRPYLASATMTALDNL